MTDDRQAWTTYAERHGLLRGNGNGNGDAPGARQGENKYGATAVHIDGVRFASKKEAARFLELQLMQKHGLIADLETQPIFPLHVMEIWRSGLPIRITTVGRYTADFRYLNLDTGEIVVEDTKSAPTKTEAYRLRKHLAEVIHGITVTEL
jgi:Protein of unknown function (DUF1064)